VLEFSRGQSSERMPANLLEIARAALAAAGAHATARGVELALRAPTGVPVLWLDETQIEQLLGNLLANGVEACGEGGRVEVRVEVRSDAVRVIVADDGCGMTEDERQQAFQPFWSTRKARGGTGLGLFIARAIAASHGGTLELASDPGKGSHAILTLPRTAPALR
jgi:signal transduction histidine kinase